MVTENVPFECYHPLGITGVSGTRSELQLDRHEGSVLSWRDGILGMQISAHVLRHDGRMMAQFQLHDAPGLGRFGDSAQRLQEEPGPGAAQKERVGRGEHTK